MISGRQPDTAVDLMRAKIVRPLAFANSSEVTSVADAPSVSGEGRPRRDRAGDVERGLEGGQGFRRRFRTDAAVFGNGLAVGDIDRDDFIL